MKSSRSEHTTLSSSELLQKNSSLLQVLLSDNKSNPSDHKDSSKSMNTSNRILQLLKLIYHFISKYFPKLMTLLLGFVFVKLYISKVFPSFHGWWKFTNNDSSEENSSQYHLGGMISHTSQNPYTFPSHNDTINQVKMEFYGHYVNPITGLPSFPDYMTRDEMQLEELRRMDGTNDWMQRNTSTRQR
nr:unnamed protein product [Naegleria fowleri]